MKTLEDLKEFVNGIDPDTYNQDTSSSKSCGCLIHHLRKTDNPLKSIYDKSCQPISTIVRMELNLKSGWGIYLMGTSDAIKEESLRLGLPIPNSFTLVDLINRIDDLIELRDKID